MELAGTDLEEAKVVFAKAIATRPFHREKSFKEFAGA
jgi:hypothetical protein